MTIIIPPNCVERKTSLALVDKTSQTSYVWDLDAEYKPAAMRCLAAWMTCADTDRHEGLVPCSSIKELHD